MKTKQTWNMISLVKYQAQWVLLGDGSVAVTYQLYPGGRVRVSFYVLDNGRFEHCVTDTGSARTLISLLTKHATRAVAFVAVSPEPRCPISRAG